LSYLASGHPLRIASGTLVRDNTSGTVRLWDLATTSEGPAMVYEIAGRHYGVALWESGSGWVHTELANSPKTKYRGVAVADGVPLTVYLVAADGVLQRWTPNGSDGFPDHWLVHTMTSTVRNRAPTTAPPGSAFAVAVLQGPYDGYTDFRSQIIGLPPAPDGGTAVVVGTSQRSSAAHGPEVMFGPDE